MNLLLMKEISKGDNWEDDDELLCFIKIIEISWDDDKENPDGGNDTSAFCFLTQEEVFYDTDDGNHNDIELTSGSLVDF